MKKSALLLPLVNYTAQVQIRCLQIKTGLPLSSGNPENDSSNSNKTEMDAIIRLFRFIGDYASICIKALHNFMSILANFRLSNRANDSFRTEQHDQNKGHNDKREQADMHISSNQAKQWRQQRNTGISNRHLVTHQTS